jgi:hypothetical protein
MWKLDETRKWMPKKGNWNQRMLNQLEGYQMELNRYQTERCKTKIGTTNLKGSSLNQTNLNMTKAWSSTSTQKGSPSTNHQPALVIKSIGFIVWVDSSPTELLQQGTSPKSRGLSDSVGLCLA